MSRSVQVLFIGSFSGKKLLVYSPGFPCGSKGVQNYEKLMVRKHSRSPGQARGRHEKRFLRNVLTALCRKGVRINAPQAMPSTLAYLSTPVPFDWVIA